MKEAILPSHFLHSYWVHTYGIVATVTKQCFWVDKEVGDYRPLIFSSSTYALLTPFNIRSPIKWDRQRRHKAFTFYSGPSSGKNPKMQRQRSSTRCSSSAMYTLTHPLRWSGYRRGHRRLDALIYAVLSTYSLYSKPFATHKLITKYVIYSVINYFLS